MIIAYLVLTYKRPESLTALLNSLSRQALPEHARPHVFIWDNDPQAGPLTALWQSHLSGPWRVQTRTATENLKMRAKRSLEDWCFASIENPDLIVHLDDDVVLSDGWTRACLEALDQGYDACGSVEYVQAQLVCSGQTRLDFAAHPSGVRMWTWRWEPVSAHFQVEPASFAGHRAIMVRGSLARKALHDPEIRIGGEDLDYSLGLAAVGGKISISKDALIDHRSLGESDAPGFRSTEDVLTSWRRFFNKWGFVRLNAAGEAGMSVDAWADQFRAITEPATGQVHLSGSADADDR